MIADRNGGQLRKQQKQEVMFTRADTLDTPSNLSTSAPKTATRDLKLKVSTGPYYKFKEAIVNANLDSLLRASSGLGAPSCWAVGIEMQCLASYPSHRTRGSLSRYVDRGEADPTQACSLR